jgi:hypothetical protein
MKYRRIIATLWAALVFTVAGNAIARPPDTLDFGFAHFVKTGEMLFREPVLHVLINDSEAKLYPYAVVLNGRMAFLDKRGEVISESTLPQSTTVKVRESQGCRYVSLLGCGDDSGMGFARLFDHKGIIILARDSIPYDNRQAAPLPLEKSRRLVNIDDGVLVLTDFSGDTLVTRVLLASDSFQDGSIIAAPANRGDEFSLAVNKYLFPTGREADRPMLYRLSPKGDIKATRVFDYMIVLDIAYTPTGEYLYIEAESAGGQSEKTICRIDQGAEYQAGHFEYTAIVRFAEKPGLLLRVPRKGKPDIIDAEGWRAIETIELPSSHNAWLDAAISSDGAYCLFYNNSELALFEAAEHKIARTPFPFAFSRCFISSAGRRIILAGEFGFEVYDRIR